MSTEQEHGKQLNFEFCAGCGGFLPADAEVLIRDGKPICLCSDCKGNQQDTGCMDDTDRLALEFAKKFNLPE
jgi:hypothetical protein